MLEPDSPNLKPRFSLCWRPILREAIQWNPELLLAGSCLIRPIFWRNADTSAVSTEPSYNAASASNTAYTGIAHQRKTTTLTARFLGQSHLLTCENLAKSQ